MSDCIRGRILTAALPLIKENGFSEATLRRAAENAQASKGKLLEAFPKGAESLVEAFSHWADAEMMAHMKDNSSKRIRERVAAAVRARIEALVPHKHAARRAAAYLAQPQHAALGATLMARSVDAMWRAAGDKASDFSYYTKRAMLGGVYGATFLYWLSDSSEGNKATWGFLDCRIGDVMRIEKFRGAVRETMAKLPDPFRILHDKRTGRGR